MKKRYIYHLFTVFVLIVFASLSAVPVFASEPTCSSCHASMANEPMKLHGSPPADLLLALNTPCYNYGRVMEEWYYVEELFVTIEKHLVELEEARFHVEPMYEELVASRDYYREIKQQPIVSLAEFVQKSGKLRFDLGKVYRVAKEKRIDQHNRTVFGVMVIFTLFILFLIISGWRVASGSGVIIPTKTKLGYDDLKEQEAKEKETTE